MGPINCGTVYTTPIYRQINYHQGRTDTHQLIIPYTTNPMQLGRYKRSHSLRFEIGAAGSNLLLPKHSWFACGRPYLLELVSDAKLHVSGERWGRLFRTSSMRVFELHLSECVCRRGSPGFSFRNTEDNKQGRDDLKKGVKLWMKSSGRKRWLTWTSANEAKNTYWTGWLTM